MPAKKLQLYCLILPDNDPDSAFSVEIDNNKSVSDLKDMIKVSQLNRINATGFALWKCSIAIDDIEETLNSVRFDGADNRLCLLTALANLSHYFKDDDDDLPEESIHILIQKRDTAHPTASKKRALVDHRHTIENWRSKRPKNQLPSVEELLGVLKEPLADSEKVPIPQSFYTGLISMLSPDKCTEEDLESLFKIGEFDLDFVRFVAAVAGSPSASATEASFHSFWDDNIRRILEVLIPTGKPIRNSNQHTETRKLRPAFGFLLNKVCVFRGEEKAPKSSEDPKVELADKFNWVYEPAPYMLGYYCTGPEMTLVAITGPRSPGSKPRVHDLVSFNLRWKKDRIANIRHLINLSNILPRLSELVLSPVNDFEVFERQDCRVEITSHLVIKTYTCRNAEERIRRLQGIHAVLAARLIPNTDVLFFAKKNVAHLSPRGIAGQPKGEKELRECIICVLESLVAAHQVPIYHRDIRWSNVIRRMDDPSKWFLIDWEDASSLPTTAQPSFAKSTHSPSVFKDGHGAEVDIWGVGYLIRTCTAADGSTKLKGLGQRICEESHRLSARQVLTLVEIDT